MLRGVVAVWPAVPRALQATQRELLGQRHLRCLWRCGCSGLRTLFSQATHTAVMITTLSYSAYKPGRVQIAFVCACLLVPVSFIGIPPENTCMHNADVQTCKQ